MRKVGFVLTLLGAFLLMLAALLRFWVEPANLKIPVNVYQIRTLTGTGSYYSHATGRELSGVSVDVTNTTRGDVRAGSGATAVYDNFTSVQDVTNHTPISYFGYREAFDRKNGQTVRCCGEFVTDEVTAKRNSSVRMSGLGLFWPPGAQKKTYMIFDVAAARPEPARYAGTATVEGIPVYRYVETVAPTRYGTFQVSGASVGRPAQAQVSLGEYYSATNTYWVDPQTGGPLKTTQDQKITLRDSSGVTRAVATDLTLAETASSVRGVVSADNGFRNRDNLVKNILPLTGLIAGLVLLVAGIALVWSGGERPQKQHATHHRAGRPGTEPAGADRRPANRA